MRKFHTNKINVIIVKDVSCFLLTEGATGLLTVPQTNLGEDSDSVCSSIPDSVLSDECKLIIVGVVNSTPFCLVVSEGATEESDSDSELQFQLSEHIDHLGDKK